jgi:hypothetical protein
MTNIRTTLLATCALVLFISACAGEPSGASPSPTPSASGTITAVTTPEQAVARVVLAEKRLAGIKTRDPALIGQASWYEVAPASRVGAFVVTVRIGWGDCEAGCMAEHRWQYAVTPAGAVSVVSEAGGAVPDGAWPGASGGGRTGIGGTATAGPVCPVERNPPDPACAARPVAGAVVIIADPSGREVARVTTGADGSFFVELAPGGYEVVPQPAKGLMGTAASQAVTVVAGVEAKVRLDYDTGIR